MYQQNPISDKRRPLIVKFLEKQMARATAMTTGWDWLTLTPVRKEKVGLFKLIMYRDSAAGVSGRFLLSGGQITRTFDGSIDANWGETLEDNWEYYKDLALKATGEIKKDAQETADEIAEADPTKRGIYALWIARQVLPGGSLRFPEDIEKTNQDLELYHDRKARGLIPQEYRDIEKKIKDYPALFELLKKYGGMISDKEALKLALTKSKTVHESDTYHVLEVKSWQLAKRLATGTGWCVRGTDQAKHYLSEPDKYPLYFIFKNGEKFALLTNHPDDRQLMDTSNRSINEDWFTNPPSLLPMAVDPSFTEDWGVTEVGQPDEEFLYILRKISDWLACVECGEFHWGDTSSIKRERRATIDEIWRSLNFREGARFGLTRIPSGSWIVAAIPGPLENFKAQLLKRDPPVSIVTDPEKLKKRIVIGPESVILNIEGATFPLIKEFSKKAGFNEGGQIDDYIGSIITRASCGRELLGGCGKITGDPVADVLHSLYVMAPCEDFPACGHPPDVSGGAYSCPPTLLDGRQSGMRCPCGAFVPLGGKYSVCPQCLKGDDFDAYREAQDAAGYADEESYEEEDDYDGCRIEQLQGTSRFLSSRIPWTQRSLAQRWSAFAHLMDLYSNYGDLLHPDAAKSVYDPFRVLNDFYERGWYSEEDFVGYFLPALEHISKTLRKVDHKDCCE